MPIRPFSTYYSTRNTRRRDRLAALGALAAGFYFLAAGWIGICFVFSI